MHDLIGSAAKLGVEVTISDFDDLRRQYCFAWNGHSVYVVLSNERKLADRLRLEAKDYDEEFKEKLLKLADNLHLK